MTFHVRLVSLPHRTNDLVESLAADVGVSNLLVLPGAAREPDGDAVQFDVQPRSANSVFENLQTFQHDHSGTVAVEYLDAISEKKRRQLRSIFWYSATGL